MPALRRTSTPCSSASSTTEPPQSLDLLETLSTKISKAVYSTVQDVPQDEREARCFLKKTDLDGILSVTSLSQLFTELLTNVRFVEEAHQLSGDEYETVQNAITDINTAVNRCMQRTTSEPPRRALLALLLYQNHERLLFKFVRLLLSDDSNIPSDISIPFTEVVLWRYIPEVYHEKIKRDEAIFKPITIQQHKHRKLRRMERLPFVGVRKDIKNGSSGTVCSMSIAPCHWEWEIERSKNQFVPGNPKVEMVVAVKTFQEIPTIRNKTETKDDFDMERAILQELRESNIKHEMIMLDWGSISVFDDDNSDEYTKPIIHHLIFQLATFSLADFLKDERCAGTYTTRSELLKSLVDIVEALACLHDNLETMHLDIKPDNILIFESESRHLDNQLKNQNRLIWKLSDFGLARKRRICQRTSHNRIDLSSQPSRSSATPATRPAGIYQAPEIEERESSQAGRRSDVWSIGCVALMVLAFIYDGPTEVAKLTSRLLVDFKNQGGCQHLFYVRDDSFPWEGRKVQQYQYMEHFEPEVGSIPATRLEAAVNPGVIEWSNVLFDHYRGRPEKSLVQEWLETVFSRVLRIDRTKRIKATTFRKVMSDILSRWQSLETDPGNTVDVHTTSIHQPTDSLRVRQRNLSEEGDVHHTVSPRRALGSPVRGPSQTNINRPDASIDQSRSQELRRRNSPDSRDTSSSKALSDAIKKNNAEDVSAELARDPAQLKRPCPGSNQYPVHWAISNKAYDALKVLLQQSDSEVAKLKVGGRTALQLACANADHKVLQCIQRHRDKFEPPETVYKTYKGTMGYEAGKALKALYEAKHSPKHSPKPWGLFPGRRSN